MHRIRYLLTALLLVAAAATAQAEAPRIAIIIDDIGYERDAGERAIDLPGPLAYAILPGSPAAARLANRAHAAGKEVLLHLPLQAEQRQETLEPGSLMLDMSRAQFASAFAKDLASVPHIVGVNNHRGSLLTRHPGHMDWLMQEILGHGGLFFVDSYTTAQSVALKIARERGVPSLRRDVFLDPDSAPATLEREFARLKKIARRRGFAVGIGHPYPATLEFLERVLPGLQAEGIELISISRLVAMHSGQAPDKLHVSAE